MRITRTEIMELETWINMLCVTMVLSVTSAAETTARGMWGRGEFP